jgi:formate dehydrogenase major subunit
VVFVDRFPTPDGRAKLVPTSLVTADELPDADYPFVLITGRQLEHWHTGSMTRRATVLDAIEPEPTASMHPDEIARLGLVAGGSVSVASRRGEIVLDVRADPAVPMRTVFIPFAYAEAAANKLTNPALDPYGKIPELKYCAVTVAAAQ